MVFFALMSFYYIRLINAANNLIGCFSKKGYNFCWQFLRLMDAGIFVDTFYSLNIVSSINILVVKRRWG